jgi:hypothetical protein
MSASKCQGKWLDQTLDQAFGLPEVLVAVSTSRLSCKRAGGNANIDAGLGFIWRISAYRDEFVDHVLNAVDGAEIEGDADEAAAALLHVGVVLCGIALLRLDPAKHAIPLAAVGDRVRQYIERVTLTTMSFGRKLFDVNQVDPYGEAAFFSTSRHPVVSIYYTVLVSSKSHVAHE